MQSLKRNLTSFLAPLLIPKSIVCRRFWSSFYRQPLYMVISPFLSFFLIPIFWKHFLDNITPLTYRIKKNNMWQIYFFQFWKTKKQRYMFFITNTIIYMRHQTEFWFKIIKILIIKMSQKKSKYWKWKTWWLKKVVGAKHIYYSWKVAFKQTPPPLPSLVPPITLCRQPLILFGLPIISAQKSGNPF